MPYYGNDFATATTISEDGEITDGILESGNLSDYFRVTLSSGLDVWRFTNTRAGTLRVVFYDSNQSSISLGSEYVSSGDSRNLAQPTAGEYFIHLFGSSTTYQGPYSFKLNAYSGSIGDTPTSIVADMDPTYQPPISQNWDSSNKIRVDDITNNGTVPIESVKIHKQHISILGGFTTIRSSRHSQILPKYRLYGTVTVDGNSAGNKLMRLYDRETGVLIAQTTSSPFGTWSFTTLLDPNQRYYIVAFDDQLNPINQAVIHDFLIPRMV